MKNSKRVMAFGLAAVLSISTLAGCGGSSTEDAGEAKESLGTVTMASYTTWEFAAGPYVSKVSINRTLNGMTFDRLIWQTANGDFYPMGADSWEIDKDDPYSLIFHLAEGAAWHDGEPVTADDYLFAAKHMTDPACTATTEDTYSALTGVDKAGVSEGSVIGVEVIDEHTIKYTFDDPVVLDVVLSDYAWNYVALPEHLLGDTDPADYLTLDFWKEPVGNGAMKFVSEIPGTEVVMETNKDYHRGAANFDTLKFIYMEDANIPSALISGDVDVAFSGMTSDDLELLKNQEGLCVFEPEFPSILRSIFINNATITDKRVRRALDISVDRETIAELLDGDVISTPILPSSDWYDETAGVEYDPELAKELLAEAAADGAFNFDDPLTLVVANAIGEKYSSIVQQNWEAIGLKVELQKMENAAMLAGFKADEVSLGTINRMLRSAPTHMHYASGSGYLKSGYPYEENEAAFINAATEEEQHEVISEFQHIWKEEGTSIMLAACYEDYAYNTRLNSKGESLGIEAISCGGGAIPIWEWGNN